MDVEYAYQDIFVKLMNMIFSGELEGLSMDKADEVLPQLFPLLDNLKDAVLTEEEGNYSEAAPYYWTSAVTLRGILNALVSEGPISLSDEDVYGLLRLLGPILIDSSYEPQGEPEADTIMYAAPILELISNISNITFSHQFDSIIARLKVLAPQPDLDDIDITAEQPAAGDASSKLSGEAAAFIDDMHHSWLSCEAVMDTEDSALQDGKIYYMNVTLEAKGHLVTDDFDLTINGEAPVSGPDITYEDGVSKVSAVFEFTIGDPEEFTVSFDSNGHGNTPEAITVQNGKSLAAADKPEYAEEVSEEDKTWLFGGWFDENGNAWDDIIVTEDMTVYAKWNEVIDNIQITFDIPSVGDELPEIKVPEGVPYYIVYSDDEDGYFNTYFSFDYEPVSSIDQEGTYAVYGYISIKDGTFKTTDDEDDYVEYAGTLTVNGEEIYGFYEFEFGVQYIYFSYEFEVTAEDQPGGGDSEDPESEPDDADPGEKDGTTPKTGDETDMFMWIALMLASVGALGGAERYRRIKK